MKLVQRCKESTEQPHEQTQVNSILEVWSQVDHLEVQLIQMFVDEGDERFLDNLKFLGGMVEESIESITLAAHSNVVVGAGDDFLVFPKIEKGKFGSL